MNKDLEDKLFEEVCRANFIPDDWDERLQGMDLRDILALLARRIKALEETK